MARRAAHDRIRRLLSVIPWIVSNPGSTLLEIASRFGLEVDQLLDDLSVVYMVGLPPYTPDALVDVEIDDESRVTIRLADYFSRPLQLTPGQGLALLAATEALKSVPGYYTSDALETGLEKLSKALGVSDSKMLDVSLGEADATTLGSLRGAIAEESDLLIDYFSYGRDSITSRQVTPWRLMADSGQWYLQAWCQTAEATRLFRLDRINSFEVVTSTNLAPAPIEHSEVFNPTEAAPRVTLRLSQSSLWVLEAYPCEEIVRHDDGTVDVTLVVMATAWLQRLLLKLGSDVAIVKAVGVNPAAAASKAVELVLATYG